MTFYLGAPQIILIVLFLLSIVYAAVQHGEPRENYNVWRVFWSAILELALLTWGGFFR